jgi:fluoroquinolone transport system ATP-binding protein
MIEVRGLRFTYPGGAGEAIHGLDFEVRAGEVFGFLGPSGAGKSTTQKIVIGLLKGYSGSVRVRGREVSRLGGALYKGIGVSFEVPTLYSRLTAEENLRFFASLYRGPTASPGELLALVGLEDDARTRVAAFSKGMKMRLNLCRALLNRPSLVFLDEPTTGQDPAIARRVKDLILGLKGEGRTVFLNTHDMAVADEICDRVAFIVDGGLRLIEAPRELRLRRAARDRRAVRVEYAEGGRRAAAEFPLQGLASNAAFLSLLAAKPVETIHTLEPTLEEVFLEVTGRRLS